MCVMDKRLRLLLACSILASTPALGQIRMLKPFGSPQGSVAQLTTASSSNYLPPAADPQTGMAPRFFNWLGTNWSDNSGQTWNQNLPYALGISDTRLRAELHDSPYDHGQNDPTDKRRAEIHNKVGLLNNVTYWHAFSYLDQPWTNPAGQKKAGGGAIHQIHMPDGGSPAIAFRRFPDGSFGVTTNPGGNVKRFKMPMTYGQPHDIVYRFTLSSAGASNGALAVWVDGRKMLDLSGVAIGGAGNGYYLCLGAYYGSGLGGNRIIQEYGNIVPFPTLSDLSSRIAAPPAW